MQSPKKYKASSRSMCMSGTIKQHIVQAPASFSVSTSGQKR